MVLAIIGHLVQKQLADDGLKKDYVSIAVTILKEDPKKQEPDLRRWAVSVLDRSSPVPFSPDAKRSLESMPIVAAGPAVFPPADECMRAPSERTVFAAIERLNKNAEKIMNSKGNAVELLEEYQGAVDTVLQQEVNAMLAIVALKCMQEWAKSTLSSDEAYRKSIGAPSGKELFERVRKEQSGGGMQASGR